MNKENCVQCKDLTDRVYLTTKGLCLDCASERLTDRMIESDPRYSLLHPPKICPVCNAKVLQGKQTTCSDACRQKLSRENKIILSHFVTLLHVSTRRAEKFGEYTSKFKSNERPKDISVERMKELESGRFKVLTGDEIFALWETYPDTLSVLLGIPWA